MEIIVKSKLDYVVKSWFIQYPNDKDGIGEKLKRLDNPIAEQINEVIGNDSWTRIWCSECGDSVEEFIVIGEEEDYENSTAYLCENCITKAYNSFSAKKRELYITLHRKDTLKISNYKHRNNS